MLDQELRRYRRSVEILQVDPQKSDIDRRCRLNPLQRHLDVCIRFQLHTVQQYLKLLAVAANVSNLPSVRLVLYLTSEHGDFIDWKGRI